MNYIFPTEMTIPLYAIYATTLRSIGKGSKTKADTKFRRILFKNIRSYKMKNTKEIEPILIAIYCINQTNDTDNDIKN